MSNLKTAASVASDITVFTKYAKFLPEKQRRESWQELIMRNMQMHMNRFPHLSLLIQDTYYNFVLPKKVLPSMRSLQFAGPAIEHNPARIYNCAYLPVDSYHAFSETMFLLLGGTGVGYSVQYHHVEQLPVVNKSHEVKRFLIGDSIEGWADAVKVLMKWAFGMGPRPVFDYSDIRPKGARLITSGGKAPGPDPLRICLEKIQILLQQVENGRQLHPIECHDIQCHLANAVLAGGIRRAAMIALFSAGDYKMLGCKTGNWWEENEQRGRANNSVVLHRDIEFGDFMSLWRKVEASRSGEPGFYFTNDFNWGTNPCCEIALRPYQFCNLVEVNASDIESQEDLNARAAAASFIATLQASYTDFHYLRPVWKETTRKDALVGVGMTGIASGEVMKYCLRSAADVVRYTNRSTAEMININPAARTTCIKPSGTSSLVLGTSSGIHAWYDEYYVRRMRIGKNESIYQYLKEQLPALVEDDALKPEIQAILSLPQKAPKGAMLRSESPIQTLERVKKFSAEWIKPGHRDGANSHNVSCTINIKDEEWLEVGKWMYENRACYNGISVLPYDNGSYVQAPFETCSKEVYEQMLPHLHAIDLTAVSEQEDHTDLTSEAACAGGACEIL